MRSDIRKYAVEPLHPARGRPRAPKDYQSFTMGADQLKVLQEQAIGVFSDMTSAGFTFQEALASVMLTGMHYAMALSPKRGKNGKDQGT